MKSFALPLTHLMASRGGGERMSVKSQNVLACVTSMTILKMINMSFF